MTLAGTRAEAEWQCRLWLEQFARDARRRFETDLLCAAAADVDDIDAAVIIAAEMTQDSIDELVERFHAILTTVGIDAS